jgi:hypothetical protein
MGTASVTVDGTMGPGLSMSDKTFSNIKSFEVDNQTYMLRLVDVNDKVTNVSIASAATMTVTISGGNYTVDIDN